MPGWLVVCVTGWLFPKSELASVLAKGGRYLGIFCLTLEYLAGGGGGGGEDRLGLCTPKPVPSAAGDGRGYAGAEMESETAYQTCLAVLGSTNYPCVYVTSSAIQKSLLDSWFGLLYLCSDARGRAATAEAATRLARNPGDDLVGRGMIAARTASKLQRGRPSHLNFLYLALLSLDSVSVRTPDALASASLSTSGRLGLHITSSPPAPPPFRYLLRQTRTRHTTSLRSPPTQHSHQLVRLTKICLLYGNKYFWGHSSPPRAARS